MEGTQRQREIETLQAALLKLREEVPIGDYTVKWEVPTGKGTVFDAVVSFQNILHEYAVEIKMNLNPKMLDAMEFYLEAVDRTVILITGAITDLTAMELRQRNIQYVDTLCSGAQNRQQTTGDYKWETGKCIRRGKPSGDICSAYNRRCS